jgi:hypothetical protein
MTTSDCTHARDNKTGGNLWIWCLVFFLSFMLLIRTMNIMDWYTFGAGTAGLLALLIQAGSWGWGAYRRHHPYSIKYAVNDREVVNELSMATGTTVSIFIRPRVDTAPIKRLVIRLVSRQKRKTMLSDLCRAIRIRVPYFVHKIEYRVRRQGEYTCGDPAWDSGVNLFAACRRVVGLAYPPRSNFYGQPLVITETFDSCSSHKGKSKPTKIQVSKDGNTWMLDFEKPHPCSVDTPITLRVPIQMACESWRGQWEISTEGAKDKPRYYRKIRVIQAVGGRE